MVALPNQLRPFNKERFDECMAFISAKHRSPLTQYDMVKLHIMADVYHFLNHGKPIIGGPVFRRKHGPVVQPAYARVRGWGDDWERTDAQPEAFQVVGKRRNVYIFRPLLAVGSDAFSRSELEALEQAWQCVMTKGWRVSQRFFHEEDSFIGRAWRAAGVDGQPIDWRVIVDAYRELHPEFKHADHLKALIGL